MASVCFVLLDWATLPPRKLLSVSRYSDFAFVYKAKVAGFCGAGDWSYFPIEVYQCYVQWTAQDALK